MTDLKSTQLKELEDRLPYRLREQFMSTPELALHKALQNMVGSNYVYRSSERERAFLQ